jgi:hypothetical protein
MSTIKRSDQRTNRSCRRLLMSAKRGPICDDGGGWEPELSIELFPLDRINKKSESLMHLLPTCPFLAAANTSVSTQLLGLCDTIVP